MTEKNPLAPVTSESLKQEKGVVDITAQTFRERVWRVLRGIADVSVAIRDMVRDGTLFVIHGVLNGTKKMIYAILNIGKKEKKDLPKSDIVEHIRATLPPVPASGIAEKVRNGAKAVVDGAVDYVKKDVQDIVEVATLDLKDKPDSGPIPKIIRVFTPFGTYISLGLRDLWKFMKRIFSSPK